MRETINIKNKGQLNKNLNRLFKEGKEWNNGIGQTRDLDLPYPIILNVKNNILTWT